MNGPRKAELAALIADMNNTRVVNRRTRWANGSLRLPPPKDRRFPDSREQSITRCSCGQWTWEGYCSRCADAAEFRAARIQTNVALMRDITNQPHRPAA